MTDNGFVERKFVASLQKALEEIAPERLEVFEKWFDPADRRPQFHIAPVIGAVGYLRRTPALYHKVMEKAGFYASQWSFLDLPQIERKLSRFRLPIGRDRLLKHLLQSGLRSIHRDGLLETARDGDKLVVTVANSLFCRAGTGCRPAPLSIRYRWWRYFRRNRRRLRQAPAGGLLQCSPMTGNSPAGAICRRAHRPPARDLWI